jgi:hypothetical protein
MVVRDTAHSSCSALFVWDMTELFLVSVSVAEQTLIDSGAVMRGMPASLTPLTSLVILFGAVLPPIGKIVKAGVEHSSWDIRGRRGIMEDAWLKAAKGVGTSKGSQGVLLLPACVVIQFLEVGQVFGQVPDLVMGVAEALYFSTKGLVPFLLDGEIDHQCEGLSREEGVRLLAGEDPSRVGVFPRPERVRMIGTVASPR